MQKWHRTESYLQRPSWQPSKGPRGRAGSWRDRTRHPGYLGAQDTYYVGTIKGIGCIYQQTFIDTYSKVAHAKLYDGKHALVAAAMLNDKVIPFFEEQGERLLRILTDRGTEYCGVMEHHDYQLYMGLDDIDHTRTKARSPQTNGICERFHRTIQDEFYRIAFRRRLYASIEELQRDLDIWIDEYNTQRTHTGKYCYGKTPMWTFLDAKQIALEKYLDKLDESGKFRSLGEAETGSGGDLLGMFRRLD